MVGVGLAPFGPPPRPSSPITVLADECSRRTQLVASRLLPIGGEPPRPIAGAASAPRMAGAGRKPIYRNWLRHMKTAVNGRRPERDRLNDTGRQDRVRPCGDGDRARHGERQRRPVSFSRSLQGRRNGTASACRSLPGVRATTRQLPVCVIRVHSDSTPSGRTVLPPAWHHHPSGNTDRTGEDTMSVQYLRGESTGSRILEEVTRLLG